MEETILSAEDRLAQLESALADPANMSDYIKLGETERPDSCRARRGEGAVYALGGVGGEETGGSLNHDYKDSRITLIWKCCSYLIVECNSRQSLNPGNHGSDCLFADETHLCHWCQIEEYVWREVDSMMVPSMARRGAVLIFCGLLCLLCSAAAWGGTLPGQFSDELNTDHYDCLLTLQPAATLLPTRVVTLMLETGKGKRDIRCVISGATIRLFAMENGNSSRSGKYPRR